MRCMGTKAGRREGSVARQILVLQVLVVVTLVVAALALAAYDARQDARATATERAVAVAETVADSPAVVTALKGTDPSAKLQPYCEHVRLDTSVDFVVVMDLDRTRFCTPTPRTSANPSTATSATRRRVASSPSSTRARWGPRCAASYR